MAVDFVEVVQHRFALACRSTRSVVLESSPGKARARAAVAVKDHNSGAVKQQLFSQVAEPSAVAGRTRLGLGEKLQELWEAGHAA